MKNIKKIALTGGPCGGKTTSIGKIVEEFSEKGYKVIVVPEAATLLINMGIHPVGEDALSPFEFQKLVIETASKLEDIAYRNALISDKDTIIICDRGLLDSKAYIDNNGWNELLKYYNKKESDFMNEYDLVIHLKTAALGKEEFYTLENNQARSETPAEARIKDKLTLNCWLGHSKLKVIGNDTNFEAKIDNVISEVYGILNKPYPIQRQYKYLVNDLDINKLTNLDIVKFEIEQYIKEFDDKELIYRKTIKNNEESFKIITKINTDIENERITTEKMINDTEYYRNIPINEEPIKKTRYCFEYKNQYYRLDIFENNLNILEIEETNKTKHIEIPNFIDISEDITNNINYRNSSIYKNLNKSKRKIKA